MNWHGMTISIFTAIILHWSFQCGILSRWRPWGLTGSYTKFVKILCVASPVIEYLIIPDQQMRNKCNWNENDVFRLSNFILFICYDACCMFQVMSTYFLPSHCLQKPTTTKHSMPSKHEKQFVRCFVLNSSGSCFILWIIITVLSRTICPNLK